MSVSLPSLPLIVIDFGPATVPLALIWSSLLPPFKVVSIVPEVYESVIESLPASPLTSRDSRPAVSISPPMKLPYVVVTPLTVTKRWPKPSGAIVMVSTPAVPGTNIWSKIDVPTPPPTLSVPPFPVKMSFPAPPSIVSLPPLPLSVSLPSLPLIANVPGPAGTAEALIWSSSSPPLRLST